MNRWERRSSLAGSTAVAFSYMVQIFSAAERKSKGWIFFVAFFDGSEFGGRGTFFWIKNMDQQMLSNKIAAHFGAFPGRRCSWPEGRRLLSATLWRLCPGFWWPLPPCPSGPGPRPWAPCSIGNSAVSSRPSRPPAGPSCCCSCPASLKWGVKNNEKKPAGLELGENEIALK